MPPLEALWSAPEMESFTSRRDKSQRDWTLPNFVPDGVTQADLDEAVRVVAARNRPPRLDDVRLETLDEGRCVQTLHHEIYFSDTRKVDPAKFRTILRQPVR